MADANCIQDLFTSSGVKAVARDIVKTVDNAAASGLASQRTSGTAASPPHNPAGLRT